MCLELNFAFINRVREKEKLKNGRGRRNKISLTSGPAEVKDFQNIFDVGKVTRSSKKMVIIFSFIKISTIM